MSRAIVPAPRPFSASSPRHHGLGSRDILPWLEVEGKSGSCANQFPWSGAGRRTAQSVRKSRIVYLVLADTHTWVIATRPQATSRRTTIADVAREAGVKKGTVSLGLGGIAGVGPATRE